MSLQNMPSHSRVWFFTANHKLDQPQLNILNSELSEFVENWKAHGTALSAGFEIYDQVIVAVGVDEKLALPSGCSIDKVFRLLEAFGKETGIDFFQRTLIVKKTIEVIEIFTKSEAINCFDNGDLTGKDTVYNTLISEIGQLQNNLLIPFANSWLGKQLLNTGIAK